MIRRTKLSVPSPSKEEKALLRTQKQEEKQRIKQAKIARRKNKAELKKAFKESKKAKKAIAAQSEIGSVSAPPEAVPVKTILQEQTAPENASKQTKLSPKEQKRADKRAKRTQKNEMKLRAKAEKHAKKLENKQKKTNKPHQTLSAKELRERELRQRRRIYYTVWTVVTLLVYLSLVGLITVGIYLSIWMTDSGDNSTTLTSLRISAQIDNGKSRRAIKSKQENGTFYLPITLIDNYGDYIHAGDFGARTIQFSESGESAVFAINSPFCTINGISLNLQKPVILLDGDLYLPLEFYQNYLTGLTFQQSGSNLEITQNGGELGYTLKPASASACVPAEEAGSLLEFATKTPEFLSDLSAYERYMNPGETSEYLTLVNAHHSLPETFRPEDLTGVADQNAAYPGGDYHAKLRLSAAKSLDAMLQEARANGFDGLQATSGYRTYAEQNYRFNSMVTSLRAKGLGQAEAELEAMRTVHRPGYSEYQTGLAVDVRYPGESIDAFQDTAAASWLAENAYKFGFILRYPQNKESVTGMDYQAWHFRYVGRYHAIRIKYLDMALEEYIDFMEIENN